MKFSVDVDCTPQEARAFLGLPDVEGLQTEMMEIIKVRTSEHLKTMDPEAMLKTWVPLGLDAMNSMQQAFMGAFRQQSPAEPPSEK